MSLCNLCSNKDDRNARIVFSTYPTMLNAIDDCKTKEGQKLFTPAHFDLIIVDESHRSIFKKVRSKTKFWQMIGRGTRTCEDLDCMDLIDGEYTDKRRFLIFDYCGNFEFFRAKPKGFESRETKTLSENIFGKKIRIAVALQDAAFSDDEYKDWRALLVSECHAQVLALNTELVSVRLQRRYVEKFRIPEAFDFISEQDKGELLKHIAPLVLLPDKDEYAKRFDNFINDQSLNPRQIAFVHKIINHIEQNGYMENLTDLQKPPFDKPVSFVKLFDPKTRTALMETIKSVTDNATTVA